MKRLDEFFGFGKKKKKVEAQNLVYELKSKVIPGLELKMSWKRGGDILLDGKLIGTIRWADIFNADEAFNIRVDNDKLNKALKLASKGLADKEYGYPYFRVETSYSDGSSGFHHDPHKEQKDLDLIFKTFEKALKKFGTDFELKGELYSQF